MMACDKPPRPSPEPTVLIALACTESLNRPRNSPVWNCPYTSLDVERWLLPPVGKNSGRKVPVLKAGHAELVADPGAADVTEIVQPVGRYRETAELGLVLLAEADPSSGAAEATRPERRRRYGIDAAVATTVSP